MLGDVVRRIGSDPGVEFLLWGASGVRAGDVDRGRGGFVRANLSLAAGTVCTFALGGTGDGGGSASGNALGAGAADLRVGGETLSDRVLVAGGAGGSGITGTNVQRGGDGGPGSGEAAPPANNAAGKGGTQSAGGAGGTNTTHDDGQPGGFGFGGDAGAQSSTAIPGGGGAGWYGGGGGSIDSLARGGGGGSNRIQDLFTPRDVESLRGVNDPGRAGRVEVYKRGQLIYDAEAGSSGLLLTFIIPTV